MKTMTIAVSFAAEALCLISPCTADRTIADRTPTARSITNRSDHEFWRQFRDGDPAINVASHMGKLVLVTTDSEQRATILQWNAASSEFVLFLRNAEIIDLVTGTDTFGRPTFEGSFDASGVPQVTGFVDVTFDGNLIVEVVEICATAAALRFETTTDGYVLAPRRCDCPNAGGAICCKLDCDANKICWQPDTTCTWYDNTAVD
jgi:hypothetical protein